MRWNYFSFGLLLSPGKTKKPSGYTLWKLLKELYLKQLILKKYIEMHQNKMKQKFWFGPEAWCLWPKWAPLCKQRLHSGFVPRLCLWVPSPELPVLQHAFLRTHRDPRFDDKILFKPGLILSRPSFSPTTCEYELLGQSDANHPWQPLTAPCRRNHFKVRVSQLFYLSAKKGSVQSGVIFYDLCLSYPPLGAAPVSSQSDPSVRKRLKHTHKEMTAQGLCCRELPSWQRSKSLTDASVKAMNINTCSISSSVIN